MGEFDRLKAALAGFVKTVVNRIDYLALYAAKVVSQNADGTLELQPDDARLPGLSSVQINLGLPDATVKVSAGSRVLVSFANGDPGQPRALLWETATATEIKLHGGSAGVARNGDTVDIGTFSVSALLFQWTPPGGGAPVTLFTLVPGSGGASLTPGAANGNGKINAGSSIVKCG